MLKLKSQTGNKSSVLKLPALVLFPLGATQLNPQPTCRRLGLGDSRPMHFTPEMLLFYVVASKKHKKPAVDKKT